MTSHYKTIQKVSEPFLFKEKKSKFWGFAIPMQEEEEIKTFIAQLKTTYANANHFCYAWQLGITPISYRQYDDGEPNNTAGAPIYGQIQSFGLTNIGIVVVRIFGGVKLGPGGLISAYKAAAHGAIENAAIISLMVLTTHELSFPYQQLHLVMRLVKKEKIEISQQEIGNSCLIRIEVPLGKEKKILNQIKKIRDCKILKPN